MLVPSFRQVPWLQGTQQDMDIAWSESLSLGCWQMCTPRPERPLPQPCLPNVEVILISQICSPKGSFKLRQNFYSEGRLRIINISCNYILFKWKNFKTESTNNSSTFVVMRVICRYVLHMPNLGICFNLKTSPHHLWNHHKEIEKARRCQNGQVYSILMQWKTIRNHAIFPSPVRMPKEREGAHFQTKICGSKPAPVV